MPTFDLERSFNNQPVIGVDEAGRGPWAGPVVVAGVMFKTYEGLPGWVWQLNDSKKLSAIKRQTLFEEIKNAENFLIYHITIVDVETIDRLNILEATMEGMRQCIGGLRIENMIALIDGNRKPIYEDWCHPIIKGDSVSLSIAAASVIAKLHRDNLMTELARQHPEYGWEKNAGYGTFHHQLALQNHGLTEHHRKSFAPIRALSV